MGKHWQRLAHFETQFFITDCDKDLASLYYLSKLYESLETPIAVPEAITFWCLVSAAELASVHL